MNGVRFANTIIEAQEVEAARAYVQGRIGEISSQLGRRSGFGEVYAMGAVRAKDGAIKYYVASKSAYGYGPVNKALLPGEELVARGIDCDLHAEMLVEQIAYSRGETLLGIGATSPVCATYKPIGAAARVPWCQWYFDQIGVPIWTPRK